MGRRAHDWPPGAVGGSEALLVDGGEGIEVAVDNHTSTLAAALSRKLCDAAMDENEPDEVDATIEAERARIVAVLRTIADRVEALPLPTHAEVLVSLATPVETLASWAERAFRGTPER